MFVKQLHSHDVGTSSLKQLLVMCDAQRPRDGGRSGRPRASPRYPGIGPHFAWALPGVARGSGNEGAGVARGASGGGAVTAAALSRGGAISAAAMSRGGAAPCPGWGDIADI